MTDITMCQGGDCPLKETCYRFKAAKDTYQSFFIGIPYKDDACEHYWIRGDNKNTEKLNRQWSD